MVDKRDSFHGHLDLCARCRNQPFNLCAVGSMLLRQSLTKEEVAFVETLKAAGQGSKRRG